MEVIYSSETCKCQHKIALRPQSNQITFIRWKKLLRSFLVLNRPTPASSKDNLSLIQALHFVTLMIAFCSKFYQKLIKSVILPNAISKLRIHFKVALTKTPLAFLSPRKYGGKLMQHFHKFRCTSTTKHWSGNPAAIWGIFRIIIRTV